MFRKFATVAAVAAVLMLAGCTTATAKPTPTVNPNTAACKSIQTTTEGMAAKLNNGSSMKGAWSDVQAAFDEAGLHARGDVKSRIETLVSNWPDVADIFLHHYDAFNTAVDGIGRACKVDGVDVELQTFTS